MRFSGRYREGKGTGRQKSDRHMQPEKYWHKGYEKLCHRKFFVVDISCYEDGREDFCVAFQSFQMMFRICMIVILSSCEEIDRYLSRLFDITIL